MEYRTTDAASPGTGGNRLIGLEWLRFLAAFVVLISHYPQLTAVDGTGDRYTAMPHPPFQALLGPIYGHGWSGVQLFWCISGFIFAWKYAGPISAGQISFRRFAILRLSRLYPLHVVTLLAVAVLQAIYWHTHGVYFVFLVNDFRHFILNLLFAQYWGFQDAMSFDGPSWSVSLELPVYALFFAATWLIGRRTRLGSPVAFCIYVVSVLAYALGFWQFQAPGFFYLGVLAAHLYGLIITMKRPARVATGCLLLLAVSGSVVLMALGHMDDSRPNPMIWAAAVLLFQLWIPDGDERFNRLARGLGDLTYASYLLHFPVELAIVLLIPLTGARIEDIAPYKAFFLVYVGFVLVLSRLVFLFFERPAQSALRGALLRRRNDAWRGDAPLTIDPRPSA